MGSGLYSSTNRVENITRTYGSASAYSALSNDKIFERKSINNAMSPYGLGIRESRDSVEHPNSLAIIIGLDVTGSMGSVPNFLVKDGLPNIMGKIIQGGVKDPQILFLGIGDHEYDNAPIQVSQFESSDELLDKWLKDVYLEGGGGGNYGESYALAWYVAACHTSIDCFEKRKEKGFLFTIGDEPILKEFPKSVFESLFGNGQYEGYTIQKLLEKASEKYHVYHIHVKETGSGSRQSVIDIWKQLLADNCLIAERHQDIEGIISDVILSHSKVGKMKIEVPIDKTQIIL